MGSSCLQALFWSNIQICGAQVLLGTFELTKSADSPFFTAWPLPMPNGIRISCEERTLSGLAGANIRPPRRMCLPSVFLFLVATCS